MERQFTFVRQTTESGFRDFAGWHALQNPLNSTLHPVTPIGAPHQVAEENFLTLYCVQDDR